MNDNLSEKLFEQRVRQLIMDEIVPTNPSLLLMDSKKAVDILLCRNGPDPQLYFIEVKFHKKNHGRLGFGGGGGIGFQPEILTKNPDYFSKNMRWVIGEESHGTDRFILLNNTEMLKFVAGKAVGLKFNNIQTRIFREARFLSAQEFVSELRSWLC